MSPELRQKIIDAISYNVQLMGKDFLPIEDVFPNDHLYELSFSIGDDIYNLMRSVDLEPNESPDEFDLIYYDRNSINNYMINFHTMSNNFLILLKQQYHELSVIYEESLGIPNVSKEPETLDDLIDSMYYDGDNYFLNAIIGPNPSDKKIMLIVDPMLNIDTKTFFFRQRYYIGNKKYANFEALKAGFIQEIILNDVGKSEEEQLKEKIENKQKDSR